jgi:hypothetical protein
MQVTRYKEHSTYFIYATDAKIIRKDSPKLDGMH